MHRILVAEDDTDIAALIRHSLEKAGYEADLVNSGRRAIDAVAARVPDLEDCRTRRMAGWLSWQVPRPHG